MNWPLLYVETQSTQGDGTCESLEAVEAAASNDTYFNLHRHYKGTRI